ncbi:hypothetical protein ACG2LH_15255 [Zhouia sp. PK063]|uniref:hypothetical protein n=1 Tax=Zhouia sp. PK063 TaxID=3373602 RepID=UPI0037AD02ED
MKHLFLLITSLGVFNLLMYSCDSNDTLREEQQTAANPNNPYDAIGEAYYLTKKELSKSSISDHRLVQDLFEDHLEALNHPLASRQVLWHRPITNPTAKTAFLQFTNNLRHRTSSKANQWYTQIKSYEAYTLSRSDVSVSDQHHILWTTSMLRFAKYAADDDGDDDDDIPDEDWDIIVGVYNDTLTDSLQLHPGNRKIP